MRPTSNPARQPSLARQATAAVLVALLASGCSSSSPRAWPDTLLAMVAPLTVTWPLTVTTWRSRSRLPLDVNSRSLRSAAR